MKDKKFIINEHNWGEILRRIRQSAGLTQEELGKRVGKSKKFISDTENQRIDPTYITYFKLIRELGYNINIV